MDQDDIPWIMFFLILMNIIIVVGGMIHNSNVVKTLSNDVAIKCENSMRGNVDGK